MKELILMQGASGSGKSTLAQRIASGIHFLNEDSNFIICSADTYMFEDVDGIPTYVFKRDKLQAAHEACRFNAMRAMECEVGTIIIDNTNTTQRECEPYIQLALEYGYSIQVVRCTSKFQNVHGVPPEVVSQQRQRLQDIKF